MILENSAGTIFTREQIEEMFEILKTTVKPGSREFVESLYTFYQTKGKLSPRQIDTLEDIFDQARAANA